MRSVNLIWMLILSTGAFAQNGSFEMMAGNKYLHYQHAISNPLIKKLQAEHIATYITRYDDKKKQAGLGNEIMNQAYIAYSLKKWLSVKAGTFYTSTTGYKASVVVQLHKRYRDLAFVIAPRMDLTRNGAYEIFALTEYETGINAKMKWYTRVQMMSSINKYHHNRSYQQLRFGLSLNSWQMGAGITADEYGTSGKVHINTGIFIRKKV